MEDLQKLLADATPGEWALTENGWIETECDVICMIQEGGLIEGFHPQDTPNARLIALAPILARQVIAARKLVEALRFYADADNWNCEDGDWEMAEAISDTATDEELAALNIISVIEADGGKAARAAIAEWEAEQ